ncbi:hypothetical protein GW17_00038125 [Ensete ventricosum]|nr:hypothetical protein GW17_00038125 [Ensete ventricosum]
MLIPILPLDRVSFKLNGGDLLEVRSLSSWLRVKDYWDSCHHIPISPTTAVAPNVDAPAASSHRLSSSFPTFPTQAATTSAASPHRCLSRNSSFYPLSQPTHATLLLWPLAASHAIGPAIVVRPPLSNRRKWCRPLLLLNFPLSQSIRSQPPAIPTYSNHQPPLPPTTYPCLLLFPCHRCLPALNRVTSPILPPCRATEGCSHPPLLLQSPPAVPSSFSSLRHNRIYRSHLCHSLAQLLPATTATPRQTPLLAGPAAPTSSSSPDPLLAGIRCLSLLSASPARRNTAITSSSIAASSTAAAASSYFISLCSNRCPFPTM